ncbi:MAG: hypothetical protein IPO60_06690 [Flavobacteriales bacterium]|nr:hypothetical protein [Flavobacteriales bacterium]MBK6894248.1 hypothetical protein [Flavobacteriales bacterium]MBK7248179.1 hypothetical protein [Flavobacteriales bacterium]MBK7287471.1 hypothetical protein [Flavobacteriales bacterium]MBK9059636.1 hypothetical protein [Flavobacteriales bacterium]
MLRVLLDTNVPLNVWLHSSTTPRPMSMESGLVIAAAADGGLEAFLTPTSFSNAFYFLRKHLGRAKAIECATDLLDFTAIIQQGEDIFRKALQSGWTDLEDAQQYHAALMQPRITHICTSNVKHYKAATGIKVVSPAALLKVL